MKYAITVSPEFRPICPHFKGAAVSADIRNTPTHPLLWKEINEAVSEARSRFTPDSIKFLSGIEATPRRL